MKIFFSIFILFFIHRITFAAIPSMEMRHYNELTFLTTHNSFNYARRGDRTFGPRTFWFPNQDYPISKQLKDGVRAFMLDLYLKNQQIILCHGGRACGLIGREPLKNVLVELKQFLESNPREIITLILESYVPISFLERELKQSGLSPFLHSQNHEERWPTLSDMISKNKRLVIFNDRIEVEYNPSWNHDMFGRFMVETDYSYRSIKKFDCHLNRGHTNHDLFILNHFITHISGNPIIARNANNFSTLSKRAIECWRQTGKRPNFLTVDFYHKGDSKKVVELLNQMENAP